MRDFLGARLAHQCFDFGAVSFIAFHRDTEPVGAESLRVTRNRFELRQAREQEKTQRGGQASEQDHQFEHDYDEWWYRDHWLAADHQVPFPRGPDRDRYAGEYAGNAAHQHECTHRTQSASDRMEQVLAGNR